MANVKTTLDTRRVKSDGTYNIIYRITHYKKVYTINSSISVYEMFWNSSSRRIATEHPNSKLLNLKLSKGYYKIEQALLMLEDDFAIDKLKRMLNGDAKDDIDTFQVFANKLIQQMMDVKRTGNAIVYQTAVNRLLNYCKTDISFNEINYELLDKFIHHLKASGLKQNSISNYLRSIRAIYNKAIKHKIVDRANYPFYDISIKSQKTANRAISKADIKTLISLPLVENSQSWRALNYFLLSFYLRGISFTDLAYLKPSNIIDGRIHYKRRKTHKNYNVRLFTPIEELISKLGTDDSDYLLPVLQNNVVEDSIEAKKLIHQWIKTTNKYLKRLSKLANLPINITTYSARYSFASISKQLGYSNEMIAEALGHEYGNRVTNIYLDAFDNNTLDAMHEDVISIKCD